MISENNGLFIIETDNTTYAFNVIPSGHLEHLYYGRKIHVNLPMLSEMHAFIPGNTCTYSGDYDNFTLDDLCLEMSSNGKGDYREPFVEIIYPDGSNTSDFVYDSYEIFDIKSEPETLPGAIAVDDEASELVIYLKDNNSDLVMELRYGIFDGNDCITRRTVLRNNGQEAVRVERLLSNQIDFDTADYHMSTFHGAWAREMNRFDTELRGGKYINDSVTGNSSNKSNPFFMLSRRNTTEDTGEVYGFNLIYSGNHYEAAEVSSFGKLRIVSGINPRTFSYVLEPGESLEAPEAVMTYSHEGFNGMSHNMHSFIRKHIVRGQWRDRVRPVLLNSWEASYFKISESKLLRLAREAKNVGIELFVMDDGWFGNRNDDTSSLGDWTPNKDKLPGGLSQIADKINALGMDFGIWLEPEMVNVKSELYKKHPEWVIEIPGKAHSEGRNQRILDLSKEDVQHFVIEEVSKVLSSANISYVKWDMNRNFSDYYSQRNLDASSVLKDQGELSHRYILGLYRCMKAITERFPDVLFEGCASGGNRFDLGILCYFPQIWASDNTDAYSRVFIQNGYSYGYPPEVMTAHVSDCPNHQTLRITPLETRFAVASFGALGYECNLSDMKREDLDAIKIQVELYKEWREVMQKGTFYRIRMFDDKHTKANGNSGNVAEWSIVSEDKTKSVVFLMQELVQPNTQYQFITPKGLKEDVLYSFKNRPLKYNIKGFGNLVNTVSPIHIRQDSLIHNIASRFVKMDGETEEYTAYGDSLMYGGVKLKQAFSATGYNDQVRYFPDFGSRLYFIEEVEKVEEEQLV